jgi:hypothetical protein
VNLIETVFINNVKVALKGKPCMKKVKELTASEEERIQKQIDDLGPEGLTEKDNIIEAAIESQILPGKDVLKKIPLGDVTTI